MLPILVCLAGAKGRGRKGKSSSPLSLSPYGLAPSIPSKEWTTVPPQPGGGGLRRFWFENGNGLFAHFGLNSVMVFEGTAAVYDVYEWSNWIRKKLGKIYEFEMDLKKPFLLL